MLALAATLAIQALVSMAVLTPPTYAPVAAPEIGVAASDTGIFMALIYAGACLASLSSGTLLRRFGAMRLSQLCLLLCGAGVALVAASSLPAVMLGGFVLGLGYGPVAPASSHILIRQASPERRALIFSLKQTGVPLGGVLAGALVPPLTLAFGWRAATIAVGVAGLALALAVEPLRPGFEREEASAAPAGGTPVRQGVMAGLRLVLGGSALRRLALASFSFAAAQLCFSTFLVSFLTAHVGFDLVGAGAVLATGQTAGIPARILWGWLADRFITPQRLLALLGFGMAVATLAIGWFDEAWPRAIIIAVALLHGATGIGWNGVYLAEVARLAPPGAAGAATGGALAVTFLGIVTGPALFSLVVGATGSYRFAFGAIAVAAALGGLACVGTLGSGLRRARHFEK